MKVIILSFLFITIGLYSSFGQRNDGLRGLTGNNIVQFVSDAADENFLTDPIDDTIHFKHVVDNIYTDTLGTIYLRTYASENWNDTLVLYEYYRDYSDFIRIETYKSLKKGYFINQGKVYVWWGNSDGEIPVEIKGADANTFVPFEGIEGGVDKKFVYYGGPPDDFEVLPGANPKTIIVFNPERGCGNCGNCYFADNKHVYFGLKLVVGADPKTFKLLNQEAVDAQDRRGTYFDGQLIK